jgi:hypothetical protein
MMLLDVIDTFLKEIKSLSYLLLSGYHTLKYEILTNSPRFHAHTPSADIPVNGFYFYSMFLPHSFGCDRVVESSAELVVSDHHPYR